MTHKTVQKADPLVQPFRQRVFLISGMVAYVALFQWAYINWLSSNFAYYGFEYYPLPAKYLALAWICSVLPALWMPLKIVRPSQLAYWVLYLTVFVPSVFIPFFVELDERSDVVWLAATLCLGMAVSGLGYLCPLHRFQPRSVRPRAFWLGFMFLALACAAWVGFAFRGNIHLVSFADIYDLRDAATELDSGTSYLLMWFYGAINPFLIAWGLYYKSASSFMAGALGQLLVYSSFGTKASLLSIAFVLGIYLLFRWGQKPFGIKLIWSIVILFSLLCSSIAYSGDEPDTAVVTLSFLVFFRSFGLAGLLTGQYFDFFRHNPHTIYSHIKGVRALYAYPFHYPLGTEIGYYHYGWPLDTTAHFWATDGIAALGLPGILVASLLCAFVFWVIDSVAQRHSPEFAAMAIFYATYSLANLSLFTTLLSGGLGLLILFLYFMPPQTSQTLSDTRHNSIHCASRDLCGECDR